MGEVSTNPVQSQGELTVTPTTPESHSALEYLGGFKSAIVECAGKMLEGVWHAIEIAGDFIETAQFNWNQKIARISVYGSPFTRQLLAIAINQAGEHDPNFLTNIALIGISSGVIIISTLCLIVQYIVPSTSPVPIRTPAALVQPTAILLPPQPTLTLFVIPTEAASPKIDSQSSTFNLTAVESVKVIAFLQEIGISGFSAVVDKNVEIKIPVEGIPLYDRPYLAQSLGTLTVSTIHPIAIICALEPAPESGQKQMWVVWETDDLVGSDTTWNQDPPLTRFVFSPMPSQ